MKRAITTYILKQGLFLALTACLLFVFGGTIAWVHAWIYLGMMLAIIIADSLVMDHSLLAERSRMQSGTKPWDIFLASFTALWGPLVVLVVCGLDKRFGRSFDLGFLGVGIALAVFLLGATIATWAMHANRYFSATVRIQHERGQRVVDGGPYRFVRHPGYLGGIIGNLAVPCILGSVAGLLASLCVVAGIIVRTALEDRLLRRELDGYERYVRRVRYRLLPLLW